MVAMPLEPPQVAATLSIAPWGGHPRKLSPFALMDKAGGFYFGIAFLWDWNEN